jgi:uncharacterized membrane protein
MNLKTKSLIVKLAIVLIVIAIAYLLLTHIITPLFVHQQDNPLHDLFPQETEFAVSSISIVAILLSVAIGLLVAHYLAIGKDIEKYWTRTPQETKKFVNRSSEADLQVLKKMMTDDEKKLVEEVEKAGEITQDSLRLRLDWSKAKVSTVLSLLDRQGIIQRERSGKTYRVRLDSSLRKKTV